MQKQKVVQKLIFLFVIALCAILLCFTGIYAAGMNLKFNGSIDPEVKCKIEISNTSNPNSTYNSSEWTTIFDNYDASSSIEYTWDTTTHLIPTYEETISLTSDVVETRYFRLTNYTTDKKILMSITATPTNPNNTQVYSSVLNVGCDEGNASGVSNITEWNVSTITNGGNRTFSLNFEIERAFKTTVQGTGMQTQTYYTSKTQNQTIKLQPNVGYGLPATVTQQAVPSSATTYYTENSGTYTQVSPAPTSFVNSTTYYMFDGGSYEEINGINAATTDLTNTRGHEYGEISLTGSSINSDLTITCNCDKIFTIYHNEAGSENLPTNGGNIYYDNSGNPVANCVAGTNYYSDASHTNLIIDATTTYYTATFDFTQGTTTYTQVTSGTQFINGKTYFKNNMSKKEVAFAYMNLQTYEYYVEMGEYPQTEVKDQSLISSLNTATGDTRFNDMGMLYTDGTNKFLNQGNKYFKLEPLIWIVIGVDETNEDNYSLFAGELKPDLTNHKTQLHFDSQTQMFYKDSLFCKPYTGGLLLISASCIDSLAFATERAIYANSNIYTNINSLATNAQIISGYYKTANSLVTHTAQSNSANTTETTVNSDLFLLAGMTHDNDLNYHKDKEKIVISEQQSYHFKKYFTGSETTTSGFPVKTLAVATATEYAKFKGAYIGWVGSGETQSVTVSQGWQVKQSSTSTALTSNGETSPYWTRSVGDYSNGSSGSGQVYQNAGVINCNGYVRLNSVTANKIALRPCIIINMENYFVTSQSQS